VYVANIHDDMLLGLDWIKKQRMLVDADGDRVITPNAVYDMCDKGVVCQVRLCEDLTMLPGTVNRVACEINKPVVSEKPQYMTEPEACLSDEKLYVPPAVHTIDTVPVICLMYMGNESLTLPKGTLVASARPVDLYETEESEESVPGEISGNVSVNSVGAGIEKDSLVPPYVPDRDPQLSENYNQISRENPDMGEDSVPSPVPLATTHVLHPPETASSESVNALPEIKLKLEVPPHLADLLARSSKHLNPEQIDTVVQLLCEFQDVFAKDEYDLGNFTAVEHPIETGDALPVKDRMRRTPLSFVGEEVDLLHKMLNAQVIQPSCSDWVSAPVLIRKRDGSCRWCIDYRKLNDVTTKDQFPLPLIEECLDTLSGNKWFSKLDANQAYWQIKIKESDRKKTAFTTKYGLFEFVRMGFGLCNAPATFSRAMNLILRGLAWEIVLAFLDDILVMGQDFTLHTVNLRSVFLRLREYELRLKPRKCELFQPKVDFLGRNVSENGVEMCDESVKTIMDWPAPTSVKEVERFCGLANYHRSFIKNFADIVASLYRLTGPKAVFEWGEVQQKAFDQLKQVLTSPPVLAFPNPNDPFVLDTDASDQAVGSSLSQIQGGQERVIAYGSYALTNEQRRYCTTRKELLAVIRFLRQFRHYLLGPKEFVVRTDHSSLTWLMNFRDPQGQLARWLEEISQYNVLVKHRPGKDHANADALSRIPSHSPCNEFQPDITPQDLPCHGCDYCVKAHRNWSDFRRDVDDVVPLSLGRKSLAKRPPKPNLSRVEIPVRALEIPSLLSETDVSETPGATASEKSETPGPTASEKSETPGPTASEKSETPGPTASEKSETPGATASEKSEFPCQPAPELMDTWCSPPGVTDTAWFKSEPSESIFSQPARFEPSVFLKRGIVGCQMDFEVTQEEWAAVYRVRTSTMSKTDESGLSFWGFSVEELNLRQAADPDLQIILAWLERGEEPSDGQLMLASKTAKKYWINRELFWCERGVLRKKHKKMESSEIVVPKSLRAEILRLNHDVPLSGHQGMNRTLERLQERFYWHGMTSDARMYVKGCSACSQGKKPTRKAKYPMTPYHAGAPMERVHMDFLGPLPKSVRGNEYVLVIVDQFTKWVECIPLPSMTAEVTARAVVNEFFSRFGCPFQLHTDQGSNFESKLFKAVCKLLHVHKTRTTGYRAAANGQVERYNLTLMNAVRCYTDKHQDDWDEYLAQIAGAIRSSVNRHTGFTPNQLMLGREVALPAALVYPDPTDSAAHVEDPTEYPEKLKQRLGETHDTARDKLRTSTSHMKRDYDVKLYKRAYKVGDPIFLLNRSVPKGTSSKLRKPWKGPGVVTAVLTPYLYRVKFQDLIFTVNHDRMKPCEDRELPSWLVKYQAILANDPPAQKSPDAGLLYCVCRGPHRGEFMIQCNDCAEWYHGACVNVSPSQASQIDEYTCPRCE
jgi:transposase InsO family protein